MVHQPGHSRLSSPLWLTLLGVPSVRRCLDMGYKKGHLGMACFAGRPQSHRLFASCGDKMPLIWHRNLHCNGCRLIQPEGALGGWEDFLDTRLAPPRWGCGKALLTTEAWSLWHCCRWGSRGHRPRSRTPGSPRWPRRCWRHWWSPRSPPLHPHLDQAGERQSINQQLH